MFSAFLFLSMSHSLRFCSCVCSLRCLLKVIAVDYELKKVVLEVCCVTNDSEDINLSKARKAWYAELNKATRLQMNVMDLHGQVEGFCNRMDMDTYHLKENEIGREFTVGLRSCVRGFDPADYKKFIDKITNKDLHKLLMDPEKYFLSAAACDEGKLTSFKAISGPPGTGKTWTITTELVASAQEGRSGMAINPSNELRNSYLKEVLKQMEQHRERGVEFPAHFIFIGPDDEGVLETTDTHCIEHVPYPNEKKTRMGKILRKLESQLS